MPPSSPAYSYLVPNSPSKAVTEQTLSPWKIRVTVEAEPEDGDAAPQFSTRTYQVPLKPCSSPIESNAVRGRSKPAQSSPARKKRSATPVRGGRGRRKSVTDLNIRVLGDEEDEDEWSPKKKAPAKRRGRKASESPKKTDRASREFTLPVEEDEDLYSGQNPPLSSSSGSAEIREIDPNRVSVRPRSHSTKQKEAEFGQEQAEQDSGKSRPKPRPQQPRNVSNTSAVSYPTPSPTPSAAGDDDAGCCEDEGVGYDTIMESEGFTMIDLDSIPSARRFLSSPEEPTADSGGHEPEEHHPAPLSSATKNPTSSRKPMPVPVTVTPDLEETELSSNVASSPPDVNNLLQVHAQRPSALRKVTPDVYSSPKLPPPPTQSKKVSSPEADTLAPKRVVNAGRALHGALASPEAEDAELQRTPISSSEDFLDGFSSGTKRELRAGLRFGEELAKTQTSFVSSNNKLHESAPGSHVMDQVWRGEAVVRHSPVAIDVDSQAKSGHAARSSGGRLSKSPLSQVQSEHLEQSYKTGSERSNTPQNKPSKVKPSLETSRDRRLEHEWQLEREAVSRQIDEATPSKVVVIDSSDDGAQDRGNHSGTGQEFRIRSTETTANRQTERLTQSDTTRPVASGRTTRDNKNRDVATSSLREEAGKTSRGATETNSASDKASSRASTTTPAHLRAGDCYSSRSEVPEAAEGEQVCGTGHHDLDRSSLEEDETDIWLLEAQESSSSPRGEPSEPNYSRTEHNQREKAAELLSRPKRKLIPSPWKRGEDVAEASTMISNGDLSGMLWQQPQEIKFGAGELARQTKRISSGGFDLDRMLSSPMKLATIGRNNLRLRAEGESSSSNEPSLSEESAESILAEDLDESVDCSSMPSSPPQPQTIRVNFNDSETSSDDVTPPALTRSSPTDEDEARPPTPRSAMKGGRLGTNLTNEEVSPAKRVVFNERSRYLNDMGEESTMSANLDSPAPEPPQPYRAPAPAETSSDEPYPDETPKAKQKNSSWVGWLWRGKADSSGSSSELASETTDPTEDHSSVQDEHDADWAATRTNLPSSRQVQIATESPAAASKPARARLPKLPSYLQAPSYPTLPPSDPAHSSRPLATSGDFTNAHFRTLHVLHAKSLRPRFHAPKHVRPEVQALRGLQVTVDETEAGMDVFEWTVGVEECLVLERFMQEVEWGWVQSWHQGQAVEVLGAKVRRGEAEAERDIYAAEMRKVGWSWSPEDLAKWLGMVVIGEVVRREEKGREREQERGTGEGRKKA